MLNVKVLLDDFINHINSMSDEEVRASIEHAERLTSGCAYEVGDISEDITDSFSISEPQSIARSNRKSFDCSFTSCNVMVAPEMFVWDSVKEDAA